MLFDAALADRDRLGHGWEGYYYVENGHSRLYDISKGIGQVLVERGVIADPEPTPFTAEELVKYWGAEVRTLELCFWVCKAPYTMFSN